MTVDSTTDGEVEGSTVLVMHATWNETDSSYDRTVLALADKDDTSVTVDENEETWSPSGEKRERSYITGESIEIEVATALATDLTGLEEVGIADTSASDGIEFDNSTDARRIGFSDSNPAAIEFGLFKDDQLENAKSDNLDAIADSEILKRFEGVKIRAGDVDTSSTPVTASFTGKVEGTYYLDYDGGA